MENPATVSKLSFFSYKAFNELFSKLLLYNPKELKFFQNRAKFDNCHFEGDHTAIFPASRSLSQRGKNERKERDLCWPPTRFLSNMPWCSLKTSDVFVTCNTTHATSLQAKLYLKVRMGCEEFFTTKRDIANSTASQICGKHITLDFH